MPLTPQRSADTPEGRHPRYQPRLLQPEHVPAPVEWGQVFTDDVLATAILDRFLHHCEVITINGPSWRMKDKNLTTDTSQPMP